MTGNIDFRFSQLTLILQRVNIKYFPMLAKLLPINEYESKLESASNLFQITLIELI